MTTIDVSNRPFADTPEWGASLTAQYGFSIGRWGDLTLVGNITYYDDVFYTDDRANSFFETLHPDSFEMIDAGIIYAPDEHWEFALHARNLTDKRELKGGFGVDAFGHVEGTFTPPRRVFFSVKYSR